MENISGEKRYEQVFGDTFALYTRPEMLEFIEPFRVRFSKNGLDGRALFEGRRCFDAGCGNGRGSLYMLMHGASHVTAYDFSRKNVETTRSFLSQFGFTNAEVSQGSLEDIPFADQTFDFVWCNGVIMHTEHPNRCAHQIARILKVGGQSWIYVYGSGGVYWRTIQGLRGILSSITVPRCIAALQLMRYETRYVAEFIDDWFATYLRTYTHEDFSKALAALGFEATDPLPFGMAYDSSHRRNSYGPEEKGLMGEGDLRYLLRKTTPTPSEPQHILGEGAYGSDYAWPEIIARRLDPALARFFGALSEPWQRIAAAAQLQRELRLQLTEPERFDLERFLETIERVRAQAAGCADL